MNRKHFTETEKNTRVRKFINAFDRAIDAYIMLIFICIFLIGIYITVDTLLIYHKAVEGTPIYRPGHGIVETARPEVEGNVAWIKLEGTNIDYPVMQGDTNSIYLNTDPYGNYSMSGSIFLDYRNNPDFDDYYSLIYGHHMFYGVMFGALDKYREEAYFNSHRDGIITINDVDYRMKVFAVIDTTTDQHILFNPTEHTENEVLSYIKENSQIYSEPDGNRIIALSTCTKAEGKSRLIVFCSIQKENRNTEATRQPEDR